MITTNKKSAKTLFYALGGLLVVLTVIVLSLSYLRNGSKQSETKTTTNTTDTAPNTKPIEGVRKEITIGSVSYALTVPEGWEYSEGYQYPVDSNTKISTLLGPNKVSQLELVLQPKYDRSRSQNDILLDKFIGIDNKTFYLVGSQNDPENSYAVVNVSECPAMSDCTTALKNNYELLIYIRHTQTAAETPVDLDDQDIETMKSIIASIAIYD